VIERAAVTSYALSFAFPYWTIEALSGVPFQPQRRQFDPQLTYFPNREPFPEYTGLSQLVIEAFMFLTSIG
jgi:hypothetical protein